MPGSTSEVSFGRQVLRRHVNLRVGDVAAGARAIEVLCECGGRHCAGRVRISADAFSAARSEGRYVATADHAATADSAQDGYVLVDAGRTR